jgi:Secretion system C-terminal sorting domain
MKLKSYQLVVYPYCFIGCFFGVLNNLAGQQNIKSPAVIGAAGQISSYSDMTIEWTLGETFVETGSGKTTYVTEGYHQPMLLVKEISKSATSSYDVKIFPNPVKDILSVLIQTKITDPLILKIDDVTGRTVLVKDAPGGSNEIQLKTNNLPEGMYILSVTNRKGYRIHSFKLIKHS